MARQHMSGLVGKTFPCSFVGSYPRPSWFNHNLAGRDILEAFRDEDFAQAYRDGVRAMIGDQEEVGMDVLCDGHLWYDKHQGFIASFGLYNEERIHGIEIRIRRRDRTRTPGQPAEASGLAEVMDAGWTEVFETTTTATVSTEQKLERGAAAPCTELADRAALHRSGRSRPSSRWALSNSRRPWSTSTTDDRKALLRDLADIYHAEMPEAVAAGRRSSSWTT